jgi:hypothetical protein
MESQLGDFYIKVLMGIWLISIFLYTGTIYIIKNYDKILKHHKCKG